MWGSLTDTCDDRSCLLCFLQHQAGPQDLVHVRSWPQAAQEVSARRKTRGTSVRWLHENISELTQRPGIFLGHYNDLVDFCKLLSTLLLVSTRLASFYLNSDLKLGVLVLFFKLRTTTSVLAKLTLYWVFFSPSTYSHTFLQVVQNKAWVPTCVP